MTKYKKIGLFFLASFLFTIIFLRMKEPNGNHISAQMAEIVPTVFVHGYKGSERSFSTMLDRLKLAGWGEKTMTVRVGKGGSLSVKGTVPNDVEHPFIQVIFSNNRALLADQTVWLERIMAMLKEEYGIRQVNLVGHSMGGLASTNFVQAVSGDSRYPKVAKLVTIGSPFKGIDRKEYFQQNYGAALIDLAPGSPALQKLAVNQGKLPASLEVLSIAGVTGSPENGDGLVSEPSALGGRDVFTSVSFTLMTVKDAAATHFGLHEHPGVDDRVAEFLFAAQHPTAN